MPVTINVLLEQYVEEVKKIYGERVKSVILYGSYARGDFKADSDIDIMILVDMADTEIENTVSSCHGLLMILTRSMTRILDL